MPSGVRRRSTSRSRAAHGLVLTRLRPPDQERVHVVQELYAREFEHYKGNPDAAMTLATEPLGPLPHGVPAAELAAWTVVANVLLNQDAVLVKD